MRARNARSPDAVVSVKAKKTLTLAATGENATSSLPAPKESAGRLKLLWISCGNEDFLLGVSQAQHQYLKDNKVAHTWHVEPGGHTGEVWKNDLYWFSQQIFR